MPVQVKDEWKIIDIDDKDIPPHMQSRLLKHSTYVDQSGIEHLYSIEHLVEKNKHLKWNEEEWAFLYRVKILMQEKDAFYFRITTG